MKKVRLSSSLPQMIMVFRNSFANQLPVFINFIIVSKESICVNRIVTKAYSCEIVSPICQYTGFGTIQEIVRFSPFTAPSQRVRWRQTRRASAR